MLTFVNVISGCFCDVFRHYICTLIKINIICTKSSRISMLTFSTAFPNLYKIVIPCTSPFCDFFSPNQAVTPVLFFPNTLYPLVPQTEFFQDTVWKFQFLRLVQLVSYLAQSICVWLLFRTVLILSFFPFYQVLSSLTYICPMHKRGLCMGQGQQTSNLSSCQWNSCPHRCLCIAGRHIDTLCAPCMFCSSVSRTEKHVLLCFPYAIIYFVCGDSRNVVWYMLENRMNYRVRWGEFRFSIL